VQLTTHIHHCQQYLVEDSEAINNYFFFFQAEDGIRYRNVTGVQTCALPISSAVHSVGVLLIAVELLDRMYGACGSPFQLTTTCTGWSRSCWYSERNPKMARISLSSKPPWE